MPVILVDHLAGVRVDVDELAHVGAVADLDLVGEAILAGHALCESFTVDEQRLLREPASALRLDDADRRGLASWRLPRASWRASMSGTMSAVDDREAAAGVEVHLEGAPKTGTPA